MNQYGTFTTTKTLPTALINAHSNIIKQFKKNFTRETVAYSKHCISVSSKSRPAMSTTVGGGYFTDSETLQNKAHKLQARTIAQN